jgi:hypothetical protein
MEDREKRMDSWFENRYSKSGIPKKESGFPATVTGVVGGTQDLRFS